MSKSSETIGQAAQRVDAAGRNLRAVEAGELPTAATVANVRTLLETALDLLDGRP